MQPAKLIIPELFESAAELLAEAFFDNPAHIYLCPDPQPRSAQLQWLLGRNLSIQPLDASFCLTEGGRVDAMGFWTRSDTPTASGWARLRAGLLLAPTRLGWRGMQRLTEVSRSIDGQRDAAAPGERFWYLNNMAVREKLRGSGVGTALLEEQIAKIDACEPQARLVLATQREQNVVFYQRLGFEVASDAMVGSGALRFRNWIMTARSRS